MIDTARLQEILDNYKTDFTDLWWKDERYKWYAVKMFQDNWNIDADDFPKMLRTSLSRTHNLLASYRNFPREMLHDLAMIAPEEVRNAFRALYDENKDVVERILDFKERAEQLRSTYMSDARHHYQNENAVSTYLWLRYPDKYYIYKLDIVKAFADKLNCGYTFKRGHSEDNLRNFYALYDEVNDYIRTDNELIDIFKSQLNKDCYPDPEYRTLTADVGYYSAHNSDNIKPQKEPEEKAELPTQETEPQYWWLNANPKIWSYSNMPIGEKQNYTLLNENGNKRRIYQHFLEAKKGDFVIGYEATPVKQIVSLCRIAEEQDGEQLWFEMTEKLVTPIDYTMLRSCHELDNMEFFINPNGSLFRLTKDEYDFIMDLIREQNPISSKKDLDKYNKDAFLSDVFISERKYDEIVAVLKHKKNIILQGAPGVGKTFAAKRLAYSIMGEKDERRIELVQFHQSYSYEDFILGYKPSETGFELKNGIFYQFCQRAANEPDKDFFFIIDEINRGNMSKIFGELLMMIENDYRDTPTTLAYGDRTLTVPRNLYIIGMMNTADRSLAMIDYALRRRFSFIEMEPAFDSDGFKNYTTTLNNDTFRLLIEKIKELNTAIAADSSLGKGFRIGHSYFCNQKADGCTKEWMQQVINYDIMPMLEEYWFDESGKVEDWRARFDALFA